MVCVRVGQGVARWDSGSGQRILCIILVIIYFCFCIFLLFYNLEGMTFLSKDGVAAALMRRFDVELALMQRILTVNAYWISPSGNVRTFLQIFTSFFFFQRNVYY